jgi:hypothetical protein
MCLNTPTLLPQGEDGVPAEIGSNQPYLNLATYGSSLRAPAHTDPCPEARAGFQKIVISGSGQFVLRCIWQAYC